LEAYAAYDISSENLDVISIVGSQDRVLNWDAYEENKTLAPADTKYVILNGANHGGFGDYGEQEGDGQASITKKLQWQMTANEIDAFY
jgi:hypothetical protein